MIPFILLFLSIIVSPLSLLQLKKNIFKKLLIINKEMLLPEEAIENYINDNFETKSLMEISLMPGINIMFVIHYMFYQFDNKSLLKDLNKIKEDLHEKKKNKVFTLLSSFQPNSHKEFEEFEIIFNIIYDEHQEILIDNMEKIANIVDKFEAESKYIINEEYNKNIRKDICELIIELIDTAKKIIDSNCNIRSKTINNEIKDLRDLFNNITKDIDTRYSIFI